MDRKESIRRYKETRRPMGVFIVRNTSNGKVFVGSTVDMPAMLNRQRFQLESGGHPNKKLQKDWDASGAGAFEVEPLDMLDAPDSPDYDPADDLCVLERMWLDKLQPYGERGYNKPPKAEDR